MGKPVQTIKGSQKYHVDTNGFLVESARLGRGQNNELLVLYLPVIHSMAVEKNVSEPFLSTG